MVLTTKSLVGDLPNKMDEALRQFMANVEATQARDHTDADLIAKYQKLAERVISAEKRGRSKKPAEPDAPAEAVQPPPPERQTTPVGFFYRTPSSPKPTTSPAPAEPTTTLAIRQQLAEAQRARATLEKETAQIPTMQANANAQTRQIQVLQKELASTQRKLKDSQEEIRESKKLASDVQDEMISLSLQLSVAEQKTEKLEKENKALVERWMKEMGGRADKMNRDMGFDGSSKQKG